MSDDSQPLLDTITEMTAASLSRTALDDRTLMLVRLAALVAVDAPPASYLVNLPMAEEAGLTLEDARDVLVAVAPIVGAPRTVAAAGAVTRALGLGLALDEAAGA